MSLRAVVAAICVVLATAAAAAGTLAVFTLDRHLSTGTVRISVDAARAGSLDLYVPLVDWGVRFPGAVRLPARLSLDVRTVDRGVAERVAGGDAPELTEVRAEAAAAIGTYIRLLLVAMALAALVAGVLVALALRGPQARLRMLIPVAGVVAAACCVVVAVGLPPRGEIADPEYYAHGPDIPAALRAVEQATRSSEVLSEEVDAQLVGLARLVAGSAARGEGAPPRSLTLASDLHSNLLALPALERAVGDGPLFFAGDLTTSGAPFEVALTRRVAAIGSVVAFVSGNHDSDTIVRRLAQAGAVVLTERGRLRSDGSHGRVVVRVAGLRVAGYADPHERRSAEGYRDRYGDAAPSEESQRRFADWLRPLIGRVDVVMVHQPGIAGQVLDELRAEPPDSPLAILTGHTHRADLELSENLVVLNGGTAGGGGVGNLGDGEPMGVAVLRYRLSGGFQPLAADIVEIDAGDGAARAERTPIPR